MTRLRPELLERLKEWANACRDGGSIVHAYLFGSLEYRGGIRFVDDDSDIDLLIELPLSVSTPLLRLHCYEGLLPRVQALEGELCQILPRANAKKNVTSVLPVTRFELTFGVHKVGKPNFFANSQFLSLTDERGSIRLSPSSPLWETSCFGIAAIEEVQKLRNRFFKINSNGLRGEPELDDTRDAIPKNIHRAASQLRVFAEGHADGSQFDTNRGVDYAYNLVCAYETMGIEYAELQEWFSARRDRGERVPLTLRNGILLMEMLAIAAEKALQAKERDVREPSPPDNPPDPGSDDGEDELVAGIPRPWKSHIKDFIAEYASAVFGGREHELQDLDDWFASSAVLGLLVAEAGRGKSALLVEWVRRIQRERKADVIFVPISLRFETARVAPVARAMRGRLLHLLSPEKRTIPPEDPAAALDESRDAFRSDWQHDRPLLVIVDGLDERIGWSCQQLFPATPGKNIKILAAARGASEYWEEQLSWKGATTFALTPLSLESVQGLVASQNDLRVVSEDSGLMKRFHELTGGDPLLLHLQLNSLRQLSTGTAKERMERLLAESFTKGVPLKRFFDRWWSEQQYQWEAKGDARGSQITSVVLGLLACALGPLRLADLCELTAADPELVRATLDELRRFVLVDPTADRYVFSHSRLREYFEGRLIESDTLESTRSKFVAYGVKRLTELSKIEPTANAEIFERRFGYVLRHHALHLDQTARPALSTLISRSWLDGWKTLEKEDGVFGGFFEDVELVEKYSITIRDHASRLRALLIKASIASFSSNLPAWLMRRMIETKLWPLGRALRVIQRRLDQTDRAAAYAMLTGAVGAADQGDLLEHVLALAPVARARALVWMQYELGAPVRKVALDRILDDSVAFKRYAVINLDEFVETLEHDVAMQVVAVGRTLDRADEQLRVLFSVSAHAPLIATERVALLAECAARVPDLENRASRVDYLCGIATASISIDRSLSATSFERAWTEVQEMDDGSDTTRNALLLLLEDVDKVGARRELREAIISKAWTAVDDDVGSLALQVYGPRLARLGMAQEVIARSETLRMDEYSRAALLGSLLPYAEPDWILTRLRQLQRRDLVLDAIAYQLTRLSPEQRSSYLDEALALVERYPDKSHLLGKIGLHLPIGDPNAARLLTSIRKLEDSRSRAESLADCTKHIEETERETFVAEVLRDSLKIANPDRKRHVLSALAPLVRTDQDLLLATLEVSRQIGDEGRLSFEVDQMASTIAEASVEDAASIARTSARAFKEHLGWGVESYLAVLRSAPSNLARDELWGEAKLSTASLPSSMRVSMLAALAQTAPASVREQHLMYVAEEIKTLEDRFARLYCTAKLALALEGDDRDTSVAAVLVGAVEVGRHEQFRLLRVLLPELNDVDKMRHQPELENLIREVLSPAAPLHDAHDERSDFQQLMYPEWLAPFLDAGSVRAALRKLDPTQESCTLALAARLAQLGDFDAAFETVRTLESPEGRAAGLTLLLGHLPANSLRVTCVEEIHLELGKCRDGARSAEAKSLLTPFLAESQREEWISETFLAALDIHTSSTRRETLLRLAKSAVLEIPTDRLELLWGVLIQRIEKQRREDLVSDLVSLMPIVIVLAGVAGARVVAETVLDVVKWFP